MGFWRDRVRSTGSQWGLSRYSLAGALLACGLVLVLVLALNSSGARHIKGSTRPTATTGNLRLGALASHQRQTESLANTSATASKQGNPSNGGGTAIGAVAAVNGQAVANEVPDPEASKSFPAPASVHHKTATTPSAAAAEVAPGAPSDAEVRRELKQMQAVERSARTQQLATVPGGGSIGGNGTVTVPSDVPAVVARVIAGANAITDFPYVFGGGHASFVDNAYDCSGSVSYALAAGGLLSAPETSGSLESWGASGPGKWITVYANAGHTYMYVNMGAGWMRYDTSGRSGVFASRWQPAVRSNEGFVSRHWPGL